MSLNMKELFEALAKAQGEFPSIPKNKEVIKRGTSKTGKEFEYSYRYADLDSIIATTRPMLSKYGLSFGQSIIGQLCMTVVRHSSGQSIESSCPVVIESNDMQKIGSNITYSKRYGLSLALGISTDDDLDANETKSEQFSVKDSGIKSSQSNDSIIEFGKWKGLKLQDQDPQELANYIDYIKNEAHKKNKPLTGKVLNFINNAESYLALKSSTSIDDFTFQDDPR
jgi:hypothetical protein